MSAIAWTIAGSDPSGGAGLQADLKTFQTHGVYGCAVPTLLTVQSTRELSRVEALAADLVAQQIDALAEDLAPAAIKTGALGSGDIVEVVADRVSGLAAPLVVDPVATATHGALLLDAAGRRAMVLRLLPLCTIVTPNVAEASALSGVAVQDEASARVAAAAIADLGAPAVLVKGGHLAGEPIDLLHLGGEVHRLSAPRIDAGPVHGLGCALSAAIAARLARGDGVLAACEGAKAWLGRALAAPARIGTGLKTIDHAAPAVAPPGPRGRDRDPQSAR